MPSAGQISFVHDQTRMRWMTSLTSGRFQPPLVLPEGDTIDFVFRWSNNGILYTPPVTPVWIFGIKDATTPSGDFLVQVNSASANAGVYTFTVPIGSAELQAWLATATSQSYAAIQITDTANGIATTPLLCQITANQNDSGTTPTSANGTLNVAAGKTVTFPLTLTFPSAAGTNGQQLTLSNSTTGLLEWAASGISGLTVGTTTITSGTTTRVLYDNAGVVGEYAISGTGSVAMTASPSFTGTLNAEAATFTGAVATTSNSGTIATNGATATIATNGVTAHIYTGGDTADIFAAGNNASVYAAGSGGSVRADGVNGFIQTRGTFKLSGSAYITTLSHAATADRAIAFPDATGTIALTSDITGGTLAGSFLTLAASSTTDATSTTAASLKTAGGLGVVKTAWLGADIRFATNGAGGAGNIFLGTAANRAGNGATATGAQNVCVGNAAGFSLTSGTSNVCLGDQAGLGLSSSSFNMCIGYTALANATVGSDYNVAVGAVALFNVTNGDNNVGIGRNAGNTITTGGNNTFIGYDSDGVAGLSNQTAIGVNATCTAANQVMLGTASEAVVVPGGLVTVPVAQTATTAAVSVAITTTALTTTAPAQAITLADGTNGQIKIVAHVASSGGGTAVLTPTTSAADYNTITFAAVGDTATLQYHTTGGWYILSLRGAVAA